MKMRYMLLLMMALLVDGLQFALGWIAFAIGLGLQAITPLGGAVGGAAAGAYACYNSAGSVIQGVAEAAKCIAAGGALGAAASAFGMPFGTVLGFGLEIVVSITIGGALILALVFNGMYYKTRIFGNLLIEMTPGVSIIPAWTFMVILCILRKEAEEKKKALATPQSTNGTNPVFAQNNPSVLPSPRTTQTPILQNTFQPRGADTQTASTRSPLGTTLPSMKDITPRAQPRAANSNLSYVQKAA